MVIELNPEEPTVLLVGNIDTEGILSTVKSNGLQYKTKRIDSSAENWEAICDQFDSFAVRSALVKLTGTTYGYLVSEEYSDVRDRFLSRLSSVPHAVFAYESLLSREINPVTVEAEVEKDDRWGYGYALPPADVRISVNQLFLDHKIDVIPYRRSAEITVLASAFLADVQDGLLFRVYVPSGRIWANETDRLLQLFRDYLTRVGHSSVRLDQRRMAHGIVYELYGASGGSSNATSVEVVAREFEQFSQVLDLSLSNPGAAEAILKDRNVEPREIAGILTRYAREAKRLQIDLRQERDQKLLSIRHRLEAELADQLPLNAPLDTIDVLADSAVPRVLGFRSALTAEQKALPGPADYSGITVNVNPQIINAVNVVVASEINGSVNLNSSDRELLGFIEQHAGERAAQLSSAVRELADDSAPRPGRLQARARLKGFLYTVAGKVPDVAAGLLQAYLENRIGL
jgi:hypothetical protein